MHKYSGSAHRRGGAGGTASFFPEQSSSNFHTTDLGPVMPQVGMDKETTGSQEAGFRAVSLPSLTVQKCYFKDKYKQRSAQ